MTHTTSFYATGTTGRCAQGCAGRRASAARKRRDELQSGLLQKTSRRQADSVVATGTQRSRDSDDRRAAARLVARLFRSAEEYDRTAPYESRGRKAPDLRFRSKQHPNQDSSRDQFVPAKRRIFRHIIKMRNHHRREILFKDAKLFNQFHYFNKSL